MQARLHDPQRRRDITDRRSNGKQIQSTVPDWGNICNTLEKVTDLPPPRAMMAGPQAANAQRTTAANLGHRRRQA